jgi:hypothetical protein
MDEFMHGWKEKWMDRKMEMDGRLFVPTTTTTTDYYAQNNPYKK